MNVQNRQRRHARVRAVVHGSAHRPRVSVHRSNRMLLVQAINDDLGTTVASARGTDSAAVGAEMAGKLKELKVKQLVFDRGGYAYHGAVKTLAETLRAEGLDF